MCYVCVLKEWGRGKTDHKHEHQVHSLQWCRKEEGQREGKWKWSYKKKKTVQKKVALTCIAVEAGERSEEKINPASLATSARAEG